MKKIITMAALAAILTLGFNPLYAGAGHGHDHGQTKTVIDEAKAKKIAVKQLKGFVAAKKLENSWSDVPIHTIEKKKFYSNMEWVVRFNNTQIKDADKQALYIFLNQYGEITGVNFTGQ